MAVLDVGHEIESVPLAMQLRAISKEAGSGALKIAAAYARLALGRGKVSFQDYVNLRLFDPAFLESANLNAYVGQRRNLDICVAKTAASEKIAGSCQPSNACDCQTPDRVGASFLTAGS